ncbi:MAG: Twin-arginine translocation pathway signal [Phenylobacterium sp.]|nr:Twin-arginine translocation pathway signal [Phenylobacterium sp.]
MQAARRQVLFGFGAAAAAAAIPSVMQGEILKLAPLAAPNISAPTPQALTSALADVRRVVLHNLHTGDRFDEVYWQKGAYVPDAMAAAQHALRDWRNGEEHFMDPKLFDLLHAISQKLETRAPFQIISGYRSPTSNAAMHAHSSGVAEHSQHMQGKASDIRLDGVELSNLHKAALSLQAGGVGLYPVSNFVHVDVARVRSWQGV